MATEEHSTGLPQLALTFADRARPGPLIRSGALAAAGALPAAGPDSARSARFRTTARDTRRITTSAACVLAAADRLVCAYVCAGCRAHAHLPSSQHALKHRHTQEERVLKFLQRMRQNLNASGRQMLKIHLRRAFIHVQQCVFDKEKICDVCDADTERSRCLRLAGTHVAVDARHDASFLAEARGQGRSRLRAASAALSVCPGVDVHGELDDFLSRLLIKPTFACDN